MRLLRRWGFVPVCLVLFFGGLMCAAWLQERAEAKSRPSWSPNGDPLTDMNHHNVLICALFSSQDKPPDTPLKAVATFMGGGGGGQQLRLYPSTRGVCGELNLTQFETVPVMVMILPEGIENYTGFTATYWEPTNQPEPAEPYAWVTAALTERMERWWIQFTFRSVNGPITSVTVGVE